MGLLRVFLGDLIQMRGCGVSIETGDVICYPPMEDPPFSFRTLRDSNPPYDTPTSLLVFGDHGTVQGIGFLVSEKMIEDFAKHGKPTAGMG